MASGELLDGIKYGSPGAYNVASDTNYIYFDTSCQIRFRNMTYGVTDNKVCYLENLTEDNKECYVCCSTANKSGGYLRLNDDGKIDREYFDTSIVNCNSFILANQNIKIAEINGVDISTRLDLTIHAACDPNQGMSAATLSRVGSGNMMAIPLFTIAGQQINLYITDSLLNLAQSDEPV